jgi:pimeloyl-ACP methyl ester carboxylesterase
VVDGIPLSSICKETQTMSTATYTPANALPLANALRRSLPIALALAAFVALTPRARAAELDQVVIEKPVVKVIGRDDIDAPIENVTVVARVIPDPETLTTDSGVKLLNDYIVEAARRACFAADPLEPDDGTCVRDAIKSAKKQVPALVARAKTNATANTAAVG